MKRASVIVFCCLIVCILANGAVVQAGGFQLFEFSNRSVAMGASGYAIAGDASVLATNPSLMTKLEGQNVLVGGVAICPQTTVIVNGNKNKTKANIHYVPHAYYTHQLASQDNVWLGLALYTRYGLGTEYDEGWIGEAGLIDILLKSTSVNPTIALKFSEDFSMALGFEIIKGGIAFSKQIGPAYVNVDTNGYGVGGNVSFAYDINDDWTAGFTWRAPIRFVTEGKANVGPLSTKNGQTVSSWLPDSYSLGIGYQPSDKWNVEFDVIYTRWQNTHELEYDGLIPSTSNTLLNYKNTWRFQLGAEYWLKDWLAFRAGYAYDQTPTRASEASFMLPVNDRQLVSTGLGFKWKNWTADWSFLYVRSKKRKNLTMNNPLGPAWRVDFKDGLTWITGLSIGYNF